MKRHHSGVAYRCPSCGQNINCHHCVNNEIVQPQINDVLVCAYCRTIMEVINDRQGIARILNAEEFDQLPREISRSIQFVMQDWENQKRRILDE